MIRDSLPALEWAVEGDTQSLELLWIRVALVDRIIFMLGLCIIR